MYVHFQYALVIAVFILAEILAVALLYGKPDLVSHE